MKTINVTFSDGEYKKLIEKKESKTWREFILTLIQNERHRKKNN